MISIDLDYWKEKEEKERKKKNTNTQTDNRSLKQMQKENKLNETGLLKGTKEAKWVAEETKYS